MNQERNKGSDFITEPERNIPVTCTARVVVVGAGVAGIAAALAAARCGADVLLIEKQCMVGGLASSGLVATYLPLCDGEGHQVSFGLAEELLRLSISQGCQDPLPEAWLEHREDPEKKKSRYEVQFNPQYFALLSERLLVEEGVRILYDTAVTSVLCRDGRITELIIENKSGRQAVRAAAFVDATGDADLFRMADRPTRSFAKGNLLAAWYYYFDGSRVRVRPLGFCENFDPDAKTPAPLTDRRFFGADGQEITEMLQLSHQASLKDMKELADRGLLIEPTAVTGMPQFRMTRCVRGAYELKEAENRKAFPDSIGMIGDWRKRGRIYEIPYRCLYDAGLLNVICAGRCISADDGMWDISRVIPPCAVTGQAAGTAAALAGEQMQADIPGLSLERLTQTLREQGQKLTQKEL